MIPYPAIDPDLIRIGPFAVRWYGVMYLLGFTASYLLVKYQAAHRKLSFPPDFLETFYSYLIFGLIIGARLGYVLFYNLTFYIANPLDALALWHGGMSFHGGVIGSVLAGVWYCRRSRRDPWLMADLVAATAPIGIGLGRLGNFINAELYGRVTEVPWGMVFPGGGPLPRHPSQLYEFLLEGVVLFTVLWTVKDRSYRTGITVSLFIMLYGLFRIAVEFFREPDPQLGLLAGFFTMGQLLSAAMVLAGGMLLFVRMRSDRGQGG
jgi:phosphatidylglycerol:prolipoprotein diacylglycerol transferase